MEIKNSNPKIYDLRFPEEGGTSRLPLTSLGSNLYRMEVSEVLTETPIYYHDIIEAKGWFGRKRDFQRIAEKSGLRVSCFVLSREIIEAGAFQEFLRRVVAQGGYWESLLGGVLIVHLPRHSACRPRHEVRALCKVLAPADA